MVGKRVLTKLCHISIRTKDKKFCENYSISHCFLDKYIFKFYAEISRWLPKWLSNDFGQSVPYDSAEIALSCTVSEIKIDEPWTVVEGQACFTRCL